MRCLTTLPTCLSTALVCLLAARGPAAAAAEGPASIERLDPAFAVRDADGEWLWYEPLRLTIEGRGWNDTERPFDRLPGRARGTVRDAVWSLSRHAAGLGVRFRTDALTIAARWTLSSAEVAMPHMPATGVSGLDLYARDDGAWRWIGAGRPSGTTSRVVLAAGIPAVQGGDATDGGAGHLRDYLLMLPLYNGVESLEIGVPPAATIAPAPAAHADDRPIVFYGTSITQGGCASRPGMAYPAILRRRLDRPVINLGFSGNGRLDPEVGTLLAEIDAAAYVLDCAGNMTAQMAADRTAPFVRALRAARPDTPIVLVGTLNYPAGVILPASRETVAAKNEVLRAAFDRLTNEGVAGLSFIPGDALLGTDGDGTVDGTHPTDLGFLRMADAIEPPLRRILGSDARVPPP
ncbi:MAG: SGNH/GDSL hydrolase family protein [Planctomycetaceae bacterium]